jgi:hypothetical protein
MDVASNDLRLNIGAEYRAGKMKSELRWLDERSEHEAVRLETTFEAGKSNGNNIWPSIGKNRLSQDKVKLPK